MKAVQLAALIYMMLLVAAVVIIPTIGGQRSKRKTRELKTIMERPTGTAPIIQHYSYRPPGSNQAVQATNLTREQAEALSEHLSRAFGVDPDDEDTKLYRREREAGTHDLFGPLPPKEI